jgi:kynurenine formamidase
MHCWPAQKHNVKNLGGNAMRKAFVLCCSIALFGATGAANAQDWTKSKWGPNDEIGAANYMTPELVVKAASLIKTGKTYALGIPVDTKTPAYPPRTFKITIVQPGQAGSPGLGPNKATYNDDIIDTWVGIGSQLDGLGHLGVEHVYYNGNKLADFADPTGLKKLGIEKVPPMVTRGVLLDMAAYYNTDVVKEGTAFNVKEIEEVAKKQGVEIRQGDVVIFHTGWLSLIGKDDKRYSAGEPGLGVEGAKYLTGKGVVAIGADTWALEVLPFESKNVFEVHQILLAMNGTYILENMDTAALAADKGYEFLFVLGQPRWRGGVQSMINPIAIR